MCFYTVLGEAFTKYVEAFKPFLCQALKNYEEYQVGDVYNVCSPCVT